MSTQTSFGQAPQLLLLFSANHVRRQFVRAIVIRRHLIAFRVMVHRRLVLCIRTVSAEYLVVVRLMW